MKIRQNIQKKQGGGIIYTPFIPSYQDYATSDNDPRTNSDAGKIGDLQKEILGVLQENGLPSDVGTFLSTAQNFLRRAEMTGDWSMNDFIRVQSMANRVAHNKGLFDAATKQLTEKGNWNEVAIDNRGYIYAMDKEGKVTKLNPLEYYQKRDQYEAMTNNDLLEYRSDYNSFDSSMINDASGAATVNDIVEYAKNIVMDFGTTSVSGYTNSELGQMDQALNTLLYGGPTGYYKFKKEMQIDDSGASMAINYLISALPANMRQLLKAKTAAENQDPNVHSVDLLVNILGHHTSRSTEVSFDSAATKSTGIGADSTTTKEDTYLEHLVSGSTLGNYQDFRIAPLGSQVSLNIKGQNAGPLVDRQGDAVQQNNLQVLLNSVYGFQVTDKNSVTFGSQIIKPEDYDKIVWDGTSQITRVFLPAKTTADGQIVPNFDLLSQMEEFQKEIDAIGGQITPNIQQQLNEYFQGAVFFNPETQKLQVHDSLIKPFLSISAYTNSHTMGNLNTDDRFLSPVDKSTGKAIKSKYESITEYHTLYGDELGKDRLVKQPGARKNRFYKGNVYIPIISQTIGVHLTSGQENPKSAYSDVNGSVERQDIITTW